MFSYHKFVPTFMPDSLWQTSDFFIYLLSAVLQFVLICFLLGQPKKTPEKTALVQWLSLWALFNTTIAFSRQSIVNTGQLDLVGYQFADFIFPRNTWAQLSMLFFCWFGYFGLRFMYRFIRRDFDIWEKACKWACVTVFFIYLFFPYITHSNTFERKLMQFPTAIFPFLWCLYLIVRKYREISSPVFRLRLKIFMASILLSFVIYLVIVMAIPTYFNEDMRPLLSFFNSSQESLILTLCVTRFGIFDLGIEDAAEEMYRHMDDPALILSNDGIVQIANPPAMRLFGQLDNLEESARPEVTSLLEGYSPDQTVFETTLTNVDQPLLFSCTQTVIERHGSTDGRILILRDITEERRLSDMKNSFMSAISHELRTPLTSILGFTKIIRKRLNSVILPKFQVKSKKDERALKQVNKNIDVIVAEGERLTALISDVLDITKMESGNIDWNFEKTKLTPIIEQALAATQGLFVAKQLTFKTNIDIDDITVVVDKGRIIQVIINLISNAVKFTEAGQVSLSASVRNSNILISVSDSGVGIKSENLSKVFERYKQVGASALSTSGTGLGLPISKEIVEGHNGEIWAESEPGVGSTFSFTIPLETQNLSSLKTCSIAELSQQLRQLISNQSESIKNILVVDDEPNIRQLVRASLESDGFSIFEASNGMEALEHIRKSSPDLIISDVMMPKMNGFDMTAILKNDAQTINIPIIMLTVVPDEKRGYGLGVEVYLRKPISPADILKNVQDLSQRLLKEQEILLIGNDKIGLANLNKTAASLGFKVASTSSVDNLHDYRGRRLAMIVVEEELAATINLRAALSGIGHASTLIRIFKGVDA